MAKKTGKNSNKNNNKIKSKVKAKAVKKPIKKAAPKKVIAKKVAPKKATAQPKKALPQKKTAVVPKPTAKLAPKAKEDLKKVAKTKPDKTKPEPPKKEDKKSDLKTKAKPSAPTARVEEVESLSPEEETEQEIVLTDAEGRRYCRVKDCDQLASVDSYCRYHYLLYWKRIQIRKKILSEGRLERYIEELTARYPDKFLDMLRKDLRSEKEFLAAIQELEIDESAVDNEFEDEAQTYIDEVRGMSEPTTTRDEEDF